MPIWLRRFTFNKMKEFYDNQNEENQKASQQVKNAQSKIKIPNYRVKVPSK